MDTKKELKQKILNDLGDVMFKNICNKCQQYLPKEDAIAIEHAVLMCLAEKSQDAYLARLVARYNLECELEEVKYLEGYNLSMRVISTVMDSLLQEKLANEKAS